MTTERFPELPDDLRVRAGEIGRSVLPELLRHAVPWEFSSWDCSVPAPGGFADVADLEYQRLARSELREVLRDFLRAEWPERPLVHVRPDLLLTVEIEDDGAAVRAEPSTVYVAGRYRKLVRGVSQTVFHCRGCRGRKRRYGAACASCEGTGRQVPESVEDFVAPSICGVVGGRSAAFHGSGREDVDVRMLGEGRPFVVSVEVPRRRSIDAVALAAEIASRSGGRVEVRELRVVGREDLARITTEHGEKTYRVVVEPQDDAALPGDAAERATTFVGVELAQRTPQRVARRADLVRRRVVRSVRVLEVTSARLVLEVRTDPGLYVKEFVSGDEGRTTPSLSEAFGVACACVELDVLAVGEAGATAEASQVEEAGEAGEAARADSADQDDGAAQAEPSPREDGPPTS